MLAQRLFGYGACLDHGGLPGAAAGDVGGMEHQSPRWLRRAVVSRRGAAAGDAARSRTVRRRRVGFLWGLLAGMAFWTHLLAVVYILPAVAYLILRRRWRWSASELGLTVAERSSAYCPLIVSTTPLTGSRRCWPCCSQRICRSIRPRSSSASFASACPSWPDLGQPTTSEVLFDQDWLNRPAGEPGSQATVAAGARGGARPATCQRWWR